MRKFKNIIRKILAPPVVMLPFVALSSKQLINEKIIDLHKNINTKKIEFREQQSISTLSLDGEETEWKINNNFELKLLLNPDINTEDENFIESFNANFISKIKSIDLKFASYKESKIIPIVWFYFESEAQRRKFINAIGDWNDVYQIIVYKNDHINEQGLWNSYNYNSKRLVIKPQQVENVEQFGLTIDKNASIVNLKKEQRSNASNNKIGILEVYTYPFDNDYKRYFKSGIKLNELNSTGKTNYNIKSHSTMVSLIAGSQWGIDKTSQVFLSTFSTDGDWNTALEDMVINQGIRLINHSYGTKYKKDRKQNYFGYTENAYYLDYLSRNYGVINVISAGNDGKIDEHKISNDKTSFNSIIVGSLSDQSNEFTISQNLVAEYSNYRLEEEYKNISKPLVVAPAYFYNPVYNVNEYEHGTSYAAPVVTGLISNLLKSRADIKSSTQRVPIIKSILSAGSVSPKARELKYKTSGYEEKYGSGTPDFARMLQAAQNHKVAAVNPTLSSGSYVLTSSELELNKSQTIKISSSWMFNAGILKWPDTKLMFVLPDRKLNWWDYKYSNYTLSNDETIESLFTKKFSNDETHKGEYWLKKEEAKKRQNNKWFADYDLTLEKKELNGNWKIVKTISTVVTNDELIEHKVLESGIYRYRVRKWYSSSFTNSVDDIVAITHVVQND